MLKLNISKEPYWLDLPAQVRVKVKAPTSIMVSIAQTQASQELNALYEEYQRRRESGANTDDLPDLSSKGARDIMSETLLFKRLALQAILEWENVMQSDSDEPAEVNPQNISALMDVWKINQNFGQQYLRDIELRESEGNASRPAANGTSAAGRNTAKPARKPISHAAKAKRAT